MNDYGTFKPKNVDCFSAPRALWRRVRGLLPRSTPSFVELAHYVKHIKHRCRGEPKIEECLISGETQFPARR